MINADHVDTRLRLLGQLRHALNSMRLTHPLGEASTENQRTAHKVADEALASLLASDRECADVERRRPYLEQTDGFSMLADTPHIEFCGNGGGAWVHVAVCVPDPAKTTRTDPCACSRRSPRTPT